MDPFEVRRLRVTVPPAFSDRRGPAAATDQARATGAAPSQSRSGLPGTQACQAERRVNGRIARIEPRGFLDIRGPTGTIALLHAIAAAEEPHFGFLGSQPERVLEQLQAAIDTTRALVADGPANQEFSAFGEA